MQGFNMGRYVPPDLEGLLTSGNPLHKKHPLGPRASKPGLLTVRFEMPFPIWCATCPQPTLIPQGVRFNASKSRSGSYHTTPIYTFTLRHPPCSGTITIQTDPKNTDYVVLSGARRQNVATSTDDLVTTSIKTQREKEEERETAFGKLEKTIADREQARDATVRIDELRDSNERLWEDPFTANRRLRAGFREGRKRREREEERDEGIRERMGLRIKLLPEREEDGLRAGLVDFGGVSEGNEGMGVERVLARPLFEDGKKKEGLKKEGKGRLKRDIKADRMRESLVEEIRTNTRAMKDPFLVAFGDNKSSRDKGGGLLPGLKKRKRGAEDEGEKPIPALAPTQPEDTLAGGGKGELKPTAPAGQRALLVSYDSDSA
ncbi:Protein saf4 [Podospora pseudopauciseta]|uniref:Protein saf4 n=1 Tax=Podospora pseudopauciseta TaxID=2093780 RepID=A0ABR0HD86_9PEZI|nr:Protein saf4 [Podospora pseudopauciseta]